MSGRRGLTVLGVAVAGGAGYYLYNAGGDPKVAEKNFEADAHKASAKIQNEMPGQAKDRGKEAEKRGEAYVRQAGDKIDQVAADAQKKFQDGKKEADSIASRTAADFNKNVDKFDAKVTQEASKAKSGVSSWFGGK